MTNRHNIIMVSKLKVESNRKTKSAKEELEELGEDTDSLITTQSKLRDTIKEATAVASNGFKGFDILNDNGNYKSTYEIMLGIAQIYQEIVDTDKELGRNNANLLLETVAGKTRANVAASIFQSPDVLEAAYKSSQEANGSAMRENDKYIQSISGHLAQLTNAWQQMWANAANRDVINFFIDAAKAAVNFANAVGVLPTTLALMLPYLNIITKARSKDNKGIVTQFLEWANGLNEAKKATEEMAKAQEGLNTIEETATAINAAKTVSEKTKTEASIEATGAELAESAADATGVASSTAKTASNEAETLSAEEQAWAYVQLGMAEEAEQVAESGGIFAKASGGIDLLNGAISGLVGTIGAVPLAIGAAAVVLFAAKKAYDAHRESVFADAKATAENIKTQQEATSQQIESYKQLKAQLDSGDLSEQETINVKQQILDIQKSITEQYGTAAQGVDLINGKLKEQVGLLDSISQKEAQDQYFKDYEGFQVAEQEYNKNNRSYNIGLNNTGNANLDKAITDELLKNGFRIQAAGMGTFNASVKGTASDGINALENTKKALEELKAEYRDRDTLEALNKQIAKIEEQISKAYEVVDKYEATALKGLELDLAGNDTKGYDIYKNYQSSVSNLEDAYISGNNKKIKEARINYEEATKAKEDFLNVPANNEFSVLFDNIDTSIVDTKIKTEDATKAIKKSLKIRDEINRLDKIADPNEDLQERKKSLKDITKATGRYTKEDKKLYQMLKRIIDLNIDKVDAERAFDASANGSQIYRNALENLMNALGYTIDDSGLMIDMLVANSIVHGDVADATNSASDAYNQFSQEIATAIENVSKLNTVLTESVSGAGISTQNIDAFKEMFGDDYVYALERSANGYHINAEKLQTLIDKQNALTNSDYQKTLDAQYDALKRCNDEIIKANNEQKDTSGLLAQRQGILQRIQDTQDLMMAYQASTSAFQTWTNAQSNGNEYDMYDKIANGYDTVKDLIDRGWSGDDTVRSYLDLIYGESFDAFTASGEECAEMFDNLDKKIEGTSFSIRDFFQFDSSGKITSNGIFNFFDALKEKQDQLGLSDDEKWIKDDGTYDFGFGRDRAAAEQLGIDVEFFQSMLRAAVSAGFELNLDQPMWAMDELEKKAIKAQEELGGFNDIDFKELYNNLDDEDAYETISGHIDDVYDYIQKIEDSDLSPELKTQQIEQAQDMLSYLVALEREAADKGEIDIKATVVGSAKEKLSELIEETDELPEVLKQYNWDEITDKEGLQKARNYISAEIEGGRIDSSSAEAFLNILDQALDELNLIDEYEANPTLQGNTVGAFNDVKQAREELEKYIADAQQLETEYAEYDIKFNFAEDKEVKKLLSTIYGEGTPEILASLGIDSGKTPEEIIEMLESGERDVDVLFKPDSSELEKQTPTTTTTVEEKHTTTDITNEEKNITTTFAINDDNYEQRLTLNEQRLEQLDSSKVEVEIHADDEQYNQTVEEAEKSKKKVSEPVTTKFKGDTSDVVSKANSASSVIYGLATTVTTTFKSSGLGDLKDNIQEAINKINRLDSRISTVSNRRISGFVEANGTAHAYGTAFARGSVYTGGKWGLSDNQTALTGELGTEIVVRDGNWFTVGEDGAEFVNLRKGDIVFNHKQSRELLENGYVTSNKGRGHLVGFANGTAYSSGNTSGATRARVATSSSKSSSSRGSGGGSRGSGGSGNSGGNSSSKDAKETKNTLDEVEILIGRIEARISDLDKIIGATYNTWEDRNDSILDNLKLVTQEISDQRKAYTTYMNKANSINLSESWKQKIRDGAFRIEDVTDSDLWDRIQEYQTW